MRINCGSMKEAAILDGNLLVVDRATRPVNGSVVVVAVNGEYTVKRWVVPACGWPRRIRSTSRSACRSD